MGLYKNGKKIAGLYVETEVEHSTEQHAGIIQIATQEEVLTGVIDSKAITPKKMKDTLSDVAYSGEYEELLGKPTSLTDFTDDMGISTHVANGTIHVTAQDKVAWSQKQNKLVAGTNITIDENTNTISATGHGASSFADLEGSPYDNENLANALMSKQDKLTSANAGEGIAIDVIESTRNLLNPYTVDNENHFIRTSSGAIGSPSATGGIWVASDFIEITPNTAYYFNEINATASSAGSAWYDKDKKFISGFTATQLKNDNNTQTSPSNAMYIRHSFRIDEGYNTDWQNTVMINEGSSPIPFEPYVEPITIISNTRTSGEWGDITGNIEDQTDLKNSLQNVREVAEGKTNSYVVSYSTNPMFNSQDAEIHLLSTFTDVNGVVHDIEELKLGDNIFVQEIDVPDRWCGNIQYITPAQNTTGNSTQTGIPTPSNPIPVVSTLLKDALGNDVELCNIEDYIDSYQADTTTLTKNVGIKVFDGTENWKSVSVSSGKVYYNGSILEDKLYGGNLLYCNYFLGTKLSRGMLANGEVGVSNTVQGSNQICFRYDEMETANDFKQWVKEKHDNNTPLILYYKLATPVTEVKPLYLSSETGIVPLYKLETSKIDLTDYATKDDLDTKQDVINDLSTIRNNASTGANLAPQVEVNTQRIEDLTVARIPDVIYHGTPKITGGQISNFSTVNYLQFPFEDISRSLPFDIYFSFTTDVDVTTQQNIIDSRFGIALAIQNGKGVMALSSNGINWDIGSVTGNVTLTPNTTYYVKYSWTGTEYKTYISTNNTFDTTDMVLPSTLSPYKTTIYIGGCDQEKTGHTPHPFKGIINFTKSRVDVQGITVWEGMADVGLASRANVSLNNLDEVGELRFTNKQDVIQVVRL